MCIFIFKIYIWRNLYNSIFFHIMAKAIFLVLSCLLIVCLCNTRASPMEPKELREKAKNIESFLKNQKIVPQSSYFYRLIPHTHEKTYSVILTNNDQIYKILLKQDQHGHYSVIENEEIIANANEKAVIIEENLTGAPSKYQHLRSVSAMLDQNKKLNSVLNQLQNKISEQVRQQNSQIKKNLNEQSTHQVLQKFTQEHLQKLLSAVDKF